MARRLRYLPVGVSAVTSITISLMAQRWMLLWYGMMEVWGRFLFRLVTFIGSFSSPDIQGNVPGNVAKRGFSLERGPKS